MRGRQRASREAVDRRPRLEGAERWPGPSESSLHGTRWQRRKSRLTGEGPPGPALPLPQLSLCPSPDVKKRISSPRLEAAERRIAGGWINDLSCLGGLGSVLLGPSHHMRVPGGQGFCPPGSPLHPRLQLRPADMGDEQTNVPCPAPSWQDFLPRYPAPSAQPSPRACRPHPNTGLALRCDMGTVPI